MAEDYYDYEDLGVAPKRKDNLFLWTVFILILIGLAMACWIGSFYVFGHPEQPKSYRLLQKLKKIEPVRRFEVTAAPQGEFLSAQKLFERYSSFTPLELERENAELMRLFVKNYAETKRLVPYIRGRFEVATAYELTKSDMFSAGTVALMQAEEFPQVLVEHLFPATGSNLEQSKRLLSPGFTMPIEKTNDVTAVLHIARVFDGRLLFTVVPLHYPSYKGDAGVFTIEPPSDLNIEAGVPILRAARIDEGLKKLALLHGGAAPVVAAVEEKKSPDLVRLDTGERAKSSEAAVTPVPVATPTTLPARVAIAQLPSVPAIAVNPPPAPPSADPVRVPRASSPAATPAPLAMVAPPQPVPEARTTTPLPEVSPQGVPLKPFVRSNQPPGLPSESGGTWRTYPAGQLPQGRAVSPTEVGALADRGDVGERMYLRGNFLVTASRENRAVLRPQGDDAAATGSAPLRVIVDYPSGAVPPTEGASLAKDSARAFQIVDVRRSGDRDGTVNVFVREVAQQ